MLLRREGWVVNQKRVYRIYREEGLEVRTKKRRRKRASHIRLLVPPAQRPNERWSMDLVTDRLESGRLFRVLTVVDQFSRECPLLEPGVSMTGKVVARALERLSSNAYGVRQGLATGGFEFDRPGSCAVVGGCSRSSKKRRVPKTARAHH